MQDMSPWYYFDKPWNLAFHDLTTEITPPPNLQSLLGLGLKFCPSPRFTTHKTSTILPRFDRDMRLRTYFAGADKQDYNPKMYVPGTFTPKDFMIPKEILHRIDTFEHAITPLFKKRRGNNNLLPHQERAL